MGIIPSKLVHIGTVEGDPIHTLAVYLANSRIEGVMIFVSIAVNHR